MIAHLMMRMRYETCYLKAYHAQYAMCAMKLNGLWKDKLAVAAATESVNKNIHLHGTLIKWEMKKPLIILSWHFQNKNDDDDVGCVSGLRGNEMRPWQVANGDKYISWLYTTSDTWIMPHSTLQVFWFRSKPMYSINHGNSFSSGVFVRLVFVQIIIKINCECSFRTETGMEQNGKVSKIIERNVAVSQYV